MIWFNPFLNLLKAFSIKKHVSCCSESLKTYLMLTFSLIITLMSVINHHLNPFFIMFWSILLVLESVQLLSHIWLFATPWTAACQASVRFIPFLSFIGPIFSWNVLLVSLIFLKRFLIFPFLLFSSISLHWSLRKTFLSVLAILWNSAVKWS